MRDRIAKCDTQSVKALFFRSVSYDGLYTYMHMTITKQQSTIFISVALLILAGIAFGVSRIVDSTSSGHIVVNEVAFSHENGNDWIELYNPTLNSLSLKGMYLSDTISNLTRYTISDDVIIPANGFVMVYCRDFVGEKKENSISVDFRIAKGETVFLTATNGTTVIDTLTAISSEDMSPDITIGRFPDGSQEIFIMSEGTPGTRNTKDMIHGSLFEPLSL